MDDEPTGLGPWLRGGKLFRGSTESESNGKPTRKLGQVLGGLVLLAVIVGVLAICLGPSKDETSTSSPSAAPAPVTQPEPSYIKDVVAYKEGTGAMVVYFVLATATGEETRANGSVKLEVYEQVMNRTTYKMEDRRLWVLSGLPIFASDFHVTEVGQGAFAHTRLICSLGRILYSRFTTQPSEMTGTVKVFFTTTSGRELPGEGSIFF